MVDSAAPINVIYFDFLKVFDSVCHQRLPKELKAYGIQGNILEWIGELLTGRRQRVGVNGKLSTRADIQSGINEGSVVSPMMFFIFIIGLPDVVRSTMKIFADNTKLFRAELEDHDILQQDPDNLVKCQLGLNEARCKRLHLGSTNQKLEYTMNLEVLDDTRNDKDLGVIIDEDDVSCPFLQGTEQG